VKHLGAQLPATEGADVRRRDFLAVAATLATGVVAALPTAQAAFAGSGDQAQIVAGRLLKAYSRQQGSLVEIGDVIRQECASGRDHCPAHLSAAVDQFLRHLDWPEAELLAMAPAAIRDRIRKGTASDFSDGRILQVRGGLLGETEVRLCAIASGMSTSLGSHRIQ